MKWIAIGVVAALAASHGLAQDLTEYSQWKRQQSAEFRQFAQARDREFAEFLRSHWQEFEAHKALVRDATPKPRQQPRAPQSAPETTPESKSVPELPAKPEPKPRPQTPVPPPKPEPEPEPPGVAGLPVAFYGHRLQLPLVESARQLRLENFSPDGFAELWLAFSAADLSPLLAALKAEQQRLHLPDWALLQLVRKVAAAHFEHKNTGGALSWYLLNQLGYDLRLGYKADQLALLMRANVQVYGRPYFTIGGERYYRIDEGPATALNIHASGFPTGSGQLVLGFGGEQVTAGNSEARQLNLIDQGRIASAVLRYDPDWIAYLVEHPALDLEHYFRARVFKTTAQSLDDFWRSRISEEPQQQAVERLLQFVQHSFKYQTDEEQFGGERYLLPSESLHYAAIDCEDRAFLLAWLIKDLLQLPVVGLHYPGHVALAVQLPGEPVAGMASVEFEGKRYVVADPTYLGAKLGQVMPQFAGVAPQIVRAQ